MKDDRNTSDEIEWIIRSRIILDMTYKPMIFHHNNPITIII